MHFITTWTRSTWRFEVDGVMKTLTLDLISSLLFLVVILITNNIYLATGLGIVAGLAQIAWLISRKQTVDATQWMSLGLVLVMGAATILTRDPRFVMIKPSIVQAGVGLMMLRPGWIERYMPALG